MANFDDAIKVIFKHEGSYVDDIDDAGGVTNFGISLRYLKGENIDINEDGAIDEIDIRTLTQDSAKILYKKYWWDRYNYAEITDQNVATKIFDMAINMGVEQTHVLVQRACNEVNGKLILQVDGILGAKTLQLINSLNSERLLCALRNKAANFYRLLVRRNQKYAKYIHGWLKRAAE